MSVLEESNKHFCFSPFWTSPIPTPRPTALQLNCIRCLLVFLVNIQVYQNFFPQENRREYEKRVASIVEQSWYNLMILENLTNKFQSLSGWSFLKRVKVRRWRVNPRQTEARKRLSRANTMSTQSSSSLVMLMSGFCRPGTITMSIVKNLSLE